MNHKGVFSLLLVLVLVTLWVPARSALLQAKKWRTYKGAWFEIKYPSQFKARPSLKSISYDGQYDSAVFIAPGGDVEFYVFSPQWNGKPTDIEIDSRREEYVSQHAERKGTLSVRRVTIRAKDRSYVRSFEDTENTDLNIRRVFGFRYRDRTAYTRYQKDYLRFKRSLRQFAD